MVLTDTIFGVTLTGEKEALNGARAFLEEWHSPMPHITAHTSGSTGTPKEIHLPKEDMRVSARATNRRFGIDASSTLLLPLSPDYIAGKMMLVRAAEARCRIIVERPSNTLLTHDYGCIIDLMAVVPSQCASLMENPVARRCLRNLIIGGAPLTPETEHQLAAAPWQSFATYGMTETCSHVALRALGQPLYSAMPGVTFDTDSRGCLVINAPSYSFGTLTTNDVITLASPTGFEWRGRYDNVINSGGVKLHPEELEALLAPHINCAFYLDGIPDCKWGTALRLTAEESPASAEKLMAICRNILPAHAVPKSIRILPVLPRTSSGKILRR